MQAIPEVPSSLEKVGLENENAIFHINSLVTESQFAISGSPFAHPKH